MKQPIKLLPTIILCLFLGSRFPAAQADAPVPMSGVSFSPAVLNFGQIPSREQPTQLLTVTFNRPLFSPDHLPSLRLQGPNGPDITLFSRSVEPNAITLVYRVLLLDNGEYGPFQYRLVLVREGASLTEDAATKDVLDKGVLVQGDIVQGLEGDPHTINFGPVRYGKGAVKEFTVGFYHSNMVRENEVVGKSLKPDAWTLTRSLHSMSVTSTSPYITGVKKNEMGMDASAWDNWQIILSPKAPQKKLEAELVFQTSDGYSLTVPVSADLSGLGYLIPPWKPSKRKKH